MNNSYNILKQYQQSSSIIIFENFFNDDTFLKEASKKQYTYGWKSNRKPYDQGHWNNSVCGEKFETDDPMYDISGDEDFHLKEVWEEITSKLGHRRLRRVYFNGYTYGTEGYFHRDSRNLDPTKYRKNSISMQETILCYCNEEWKPDWAGETNFMSTKDESTIISSVLPKLNRVVYFNGEINHCARPVSRAFNGLRTVLAFKTIRDFYDEENAVSFIKKLTTNIPHKGKSFFEHLYNCMMMLKDSGFPQEVYLAALFHSVYDTEFFKANLKINRNEVSDIIGPDSESLVHLFCTLRPRLETIISGNMSEVIRYHLALIEFVNLIEQGVKNPKIDDLLSIIKKQERSMRKIKVDW